MDRVCCILDVDGFTAGSTFLVRELGYVRVHPDSTYLPRSYRFDLRPVLDLNSCPPNIRQTVSFQSRKVVGMPVFPANGEQVMPYGHLEEVVRELYDRCKGADRLDLIAYKGGQRERDLLKFLSIPSVDLQQFSCPTYERLIGGSRAPADCGWHRLTDRGNRVVHCPMAEVVAYRDWHVAFCEKYRECAWFSSCANSSSASSSALCSWDRSASSDSE